MVMFTFNREREVSFTDYSFTPDFVICEGEFVFCAQFDVALYLLSVAADQI